MIRKTVIKNTLLVWLFLMPVLQPARAEDTASAEYQIKAAFLYNFLKFVEWPETKVKGPNDPIIVGIIGQDLFKDAFDSTKNRMLEGRKVIINKFKGIEELQKEDPKKNFNQHPQIEDIRKSHMVFVCSSEKKYISEILKSVEGHSILTIADTPSFLEAGGIINLLMEENKVRFEINIATAKKARIQIRSQLLRLAKKVIKEESNSAGS